MQDVSGGGRICTHSCQASPLKAGMYFSVCVSLPPPSKAGVRILTDGQERMEGWGSLGHQLTPGFLSPSHEPLQWLQVTDTSWI